MRRFLIYNSVFTKWTFLDATRHVHMFFSACVPGARAGRFSGGWQKRITSQPNLRDIFLLEKMCDADVFWGRMNRRLPIPGRAMCTRVSFKSGNHQASLVRVPFRRMLLGIHSTDWTRCEISCYCWLRKNTRRTVSFVRNCVCVAADLVMCTWVGIKKILKRRRRGPEIWLYIVRTAV